MSDLIPGVAQPLADDADPGLVSPGSAGLEESLAADVDSGLVSSSSAESQQPLVGDAGLGSVGLDEPSAQDTAQLRPPPARRLARVSVVVLLVAALALLLLPVPYVIEMPGPTFNTIGQFDGSELIQVPDQPNHELTGELRMATVITAGADKDLPLLRALVSWFDPKSTVIPYDAAYPPGSTRQERQELGAQQMVSSQELATVAALTKLGYSIGIKVAGRESPQAQEALADGDMILAVNGTKVDSFDSLLAVLSAIPGGSQVTLTIERDRQTQDITMITDKADDGGSKLGIYVGYGLPLEVHFGLDNVGGSSAGLMFALGIIDELGDVDLAAGHIIAGTGTIDPDGNVGPIGGIRQKLHASARDGASYFLAPAANCDEVVNQVPVDLQDIKVATLDEALAALAAIRTNQADTLPSCGD